jgi:hypothetical protein
MKELRSGDAPELRVQCRGFLSLSELHGSLCTDHDLLDPGLLFPDLGSGLVPPINVYSFAVLLYALFAVASLTEMEAIERDRLFARSGRNPPFGGWPLRESSIWSIMTMV